MIYRESTATRPAPNAAAASMLSRRWRLFLRPLVLAVPLVACLSLSGCFNSESDYQQLVEEKESLKGELDAAARENDILTGALHNVRKEQESLQILVNTARSRIASETSTAPPSTAPLQPLTGDSQTISWGGWEWAIPPDALPEAVEEAAPTPAPSSGGRIYRPRPGDVLSSIASRHNTTVSELVRLNPYLSNRRNYMIWETDEIRLP